ncbi:MAG: sigma-70 family RNA polymerase sigma factor [Planctomycetes bacterium]|nr:sigma-70 family RNA polymerase sigma factor [Planctomycetota bacterium]
MDSELAEHLKLARQGDIQAFGYVVTALQPLVLAVCRRYLRPHEAEDAAQETFLRAWSRLGEVRDLQAFPGWLSAVARTLALRSVRGKRADLLDADAPSRPDSADEIERGEAAHAIRRAIAELKDGHKGVIERHYLEGSKLEEIAALLGLPLGTVKRRLFEAREQLRARLAGFNPAEKPGTGKIRFPL